jgi:hypothetical protein
MLDRVDKVLDKLASEGSTITIGVHRGWLPADKSGFV